MNIFTVYNFQIKQLFLIVMYINRKIIPSLFLLVFSLVQKLLHHLMPGNTWKGKRLVDLLFNKNKIYLLTYCWHEGLLNVNFYSNTEMYVKKRKESLHILVYKGCVSRPGIEINTIWELLMNKKETWQQGWRSIRKKKEAAVNEAEHDTNSISRKEEY